MKKSTTPDFAVFLLFRFPLHTVGLCCTFCCHTDAFVFSLFSCTGYLITTRHLSLYIVYQFTCTRFIHSDFVIISRKDGGILVSSSLRFRKTQSRTSSESSLRAYRLNQTERMNGSDCSSWWSADYYNDPAHDRAQWQTTATAPGRRRRLR